MSSSVTWLGHASALIELAGERVLIDPLGRRRCRTLPDYQAILITHAHVDHLNRWTLKKLNKAATLFVPARDYAAIDNAVSFTDLQPRVGLSYDLRGDGRTALEPHRQRGTFAVDDLASMSDALGHRARDHGRAELDRSAADELDAEDVDETGLFGDRGGGEHDDASFAHIGRHRQQGQPGD